MNWRLTDDALQSARFCISFDGISELIIKCLVGITILTSIWKVKKEAKKKQCSRCHEEREEHEEHIRESVHLRLGMTSHKNRSENQERRRGQTEQDARASKQIKRKGWDVHIEPATEGCASGREVASGDPSIWWLELAVPQECEPSEWLSLLLSIP